MSVEIKEEETFKIPNEDLLKISTKIKKGSKDRMSEIRTIVDDRNKESLYTIEKDVICTKCGNIGAVQFYGNWYKGPKHMSAAIGPGGTIPYTCLACGSVGIIDGDTLEGYHKVFDRLERRSAAND